MHESFPAGPFRTRSASPTGPSRSLLARLVVTLGVVLPLWLLTIALPATAQTAPDGQTELSAHATGLLGQAGFSDAHRFFGLNAGFLYGRWGISGEIHRGSGNGFGSTYLGGGPLVRHALHPRAELQAFVGIGHYRERLDRDNRDRNVTGPSAGLQLRTPTGPVVLVLGATGWWGSYDGPDTPVASVPGRGLRIVLGVSR